VGGEQPHGHRGVIRHTQPRFLRGGRSSRAPTSTERLLSSPESTASESVQSRLVGLLLPVVALVVVVAESACVSVSDAKAANHAIVEGV
jgi:hypothetical protein